MEGYMQLGFLADLIPMDEVGKGSKKAKKDGKKDTAPAKVKESKYAAPLKLVFDSLETFELTEGEFTKKELFAKIAENTGIGLFNEKEGSFTLNKLEDGCYLVRPSYGSKYEKGSSGTKLLLEQHRNLEDIIESEEDGPITVEALKEHLLETYGIKTTIYLVGDTYIPVPQLEKADISSDSFPLQITALTLFGEKLEVSAEEYEELKNELAESDDTSEETVLKNTGDDENEEMSEAEVISDAVLKKILGTFFPDYPDLDFGYDAEKNLLQVAHKALSSGNSAAAPAKAKEETYPTNATVSLVFTKINLAPEMFDGKKDITKKELLKFIGKTYPEYSPERTEILYDKKKNLIIPTLKSGKRGSDYFLEDFDEHRQENTQLMSITALKGQKDEDGCVKGVFYYNLPKIPFEILKEIIHFFWDVFAIKRTEAIAQVFFNKSKQKYEIHIPEQTVSVSEVEFLRDTDKELDENLILALEIHSHGMHRAFWSATDNREEKSHRLYAVAGEMGSFRYDDRHLIMRACTGGWHVRVPLDTIFEFPKIADEFNPWIAKIRFLNLN